MPIMAKLTKGIEKNNQELQSLPSLEKRVKEMAAEIISYRYYFPIFMVLFNIQWKMFFCDEEDLQSQAVDLNLLQEKIAISSDAALKWRLNFNGYLSRTNEKLTKPKIFSTLSQQSKERLQP